MERERKNSFTLLLVVLTVFLLLIPLVASGHRPGLGFIAIFATVLVTSVFAISRDRKLAITAGVVAVLAVTLRVAHLASGTLWLDAAGWGAAILFLGLVASIVLAHVLAPGRVDFDRIAGAICAYLLLGLLWSFAYDLIDLLDPAAFRGLAAEGREAALTYFSFVTLTSLGYGDIVPASPLARTLAWMEAVAGQMYLAVTVATLVGLRIAHGRQETDDG